MKGYTSDGKELGFAKLVVYMKNPLETLLYGIKPMDAAEYTARTGYVLLLQGDVNVSYFKPTQTEETPDFRRIAVRGRFVGSKHIKHLPMGATELDLSKCGKNFIDADTVLPMAVNSINCAYCVQSLDILVDKIPQTVKEIIVEPNLIKPSFLLQNSDKLSAAIKLAVAFPQAYIYDTSRKYELHDVLDDIANQMETINNQQPVVQKVEQEPEINKLSDKVAGQHIDIKDIIDLCKQDSAFDDFDTNSDDFKRKIRFVLSNTAELDKELMSRADGTVANCIDSAAWPVVRQKLLDLFDVKKAADKVATTQNSTDTEQKTNTVVSKPAINAQNVKEPIDIPKYISESLLKRAKKSSGPDKLRNILLAINEINLDIADDFNYQGAVKIIKNGAMTVSSTVKKENGCALAQSCDSNTNNDRKRLVWTMGDGPNGPVIVCMGFFEEHGETIRRHKPYDECLKAASKRSSFSAKELSKYKNVSDLLNTPTDTNAMRMKMFIDTITHCK